MCKRPFAETFQLKMIRQLIAYINKDIDYLSSSLTQLNKLLVSLTKHLHEEEIELEF